MGLYLQGFTMGLAYVAPIGMQNLFVINSALTKTRRRALVTAVIVAVFDIILSLSCFFGIGALMQRYEWLQLGVLAVGGVVVIRIGLGLLLPHGIKGIKAMLKRSGAVGGSVSGLQEGSARVDASPIRNGSAGVAEDEDVAGDHGLLRTIGKACVVTWFNPQAIVDGTLMLGAFSATLTAQQSPPFITGVETASVLWFLGVTLLISAFSHKFSPKVIEMLNRICGVVIIAYGLKLLFDFAAAVL